MFDIGFWELSLIGIVALLVIGPERLPAVARTAGKWLGKANRFISSVKDDINKELKDEDLKRILQEQQKLAEEFKQSATAARSEVESLKNPHSFDDLLEINETDKTDKTESKSSGSSSQKQADSSIPAGKDEALAMATDNVTKTAKKQTNEQAG